jgi:hypothetical protein
LSDLRTFPAEGIRHLIVEQMAHDAIIEGSSDPARFGAACRPGGEDSAPVVDVQGEVARISAVTVMRLSVPPGATVTVKSARGDLRVRRLAGDVNLESVRGGLRLSDLQGIVRVAQVDADLRAQATADLRLMGNCNGDLRFDDGEHLVAESVAGDVRISNTGDARLGRVRGDLWAERMRGALQVSRTEGDVRLTEIGGVVTLRAISGDLRADALTGGLTASQVTGDAVLQGPYGNTGLYSLLAEGDVVLHLPSEVHARVTVQAAGRIRSDAPLTPAGDGSTSLTTTLGRGTLQMNLSSGRDLRIVREGSRARARTPSRPPKEPKPAHPPSADRPKAPGPSAAEQVAVLRLLEEGKITPDEADLLLKALGS